MRLVVPLAACALASCAVRHEARTIKRPWEEFCVGRPKVVERQGLHRTPLAEIMELRRLYWSLPDSLHSAEGLSRFVRNWTASKRDPDSAQIEVLREAVLTAGNTVSSFPELAAHALATTDSGKKVLAEVLAVAWASDRGGFVSAMQITNVAISGLESSRTGQATAREGAVEGFCQLADVVDRLDSIVLEGREPQRSPRTDSIATRLYQARLLRVILSSGPEAESRRVLNELHRSAALSRYYQRLLAEIDSTPRAQD